MFSKLRDKLKQAVSIFSKKTEEAVEEKPVEKKVEEKKKEIKEKSAEKKFIQKESKKEDKKQVKDKSKKEQKSAKGKQKKEKKKEIKKEKAEELVEENEETRPIVEEEKVPEEPKAEKSFFKKLFSRKEEETEAIKVEVTATKEEKAEESKDRTAEEKAQRSEASSASKAEPSAESFFGKIKTSLTTKKISSEKFEELFWELEIALLENNVSVEVIEKIKEDLKIELVDKPLPRDVSKKIEETLQRTLTEILSFEKIDLLKAARQKDKPLVIAFFGINGTGKTTSIAKLAHYFQKNKLSVVLAACDTFRAAAIQQLEEHADKLGVKVIKHDYGADAAAVAFDAVKYAEKNKIKVVLLDTAGRLHSNTNLMQELEKIMRVAKPDFKIFVGESITGNDCIEQAKTFNDLVEMDGVILTKADVDEKGGAPLSISYTIKKPILFLGMGQRYEDLEEFDAKVILKRLGF